MAGETPAAPGTKKSPLRRTPLVVLAVFLVLFLIGVTLGEPTRVLEQARSVCLACIGIG